MGKRKTQLERDAADLCQKVFESEAYSRAASQVEEQVVGLGGLQCHGDGVDVAGGDLRLVGPDTVMLCQNCHFDLEGRG